MYKLSKLEKTNIEEWLPHAINDEVFMDMNGKLYTLDDIDTKLITITYFVEEHYQFEDIVYYKMFTYQDAFNHTDNCSGIEEIKATEQYFNELLKRDETFIAKVFNKKRIKADKDPSAAEDWDPWSHIDD